MSDVAINQKIRNSFWLTRLLPYSPRPSRVLCVAWEVAVSEAVRVRAYDWLREQADATVAEYVMSRLSPVPAAELATKDDVHAVKDDLRAVKDDLREVKKDVRDLKKDVARIDGKVDAMAVRMDEKFDQLVELRYADLKERAAEREADRRETGRRTWKIALALPVEVVLLFAGAAAILEWLRG